MISFSPFLVKITSLILCPSIIAKGPDFCRTQVRCFSMEEREQNRVLVLNVSYFMHDLHPSTNQSLEVMTREAERTTMSKND